MRLIDVDKLLEKTKCLFKDLNSTEDYMGIGYNHGVGDSMAIIKNAPTIEAEPVKHGRLEWRKEKTIWQTGYYCSECQGFFDKDYDMVKYFNFCPHCGAKMDLEREDHE